ncbi:MAG: eukaryotic-like serine/threonine-protein kinase [Actinomycetota bacterium]|nr:eukaryotic-like serine/threonine-protein kinase [Actinomycetota bacterium]
MRRPSVLVVAAALTVMLAGCDWPMFGFNPARTGFTPDTSISLSSVASGSANPAWTGITSGLVEASAAVANGVVYVGDNDDKLYAFDAAGSTNCSGAPKKCSPLWTATRGGGGLGLDLASPTVANGVVYIGASVGLLYAFDASGKTNCSGTPKTCLPLWIAPTGSRLVWSSPVVVDGVVYVGSDDNRLYAFDAGGNTNCSGVPKVCAPLWTAETDGIVRAAPAVVNGIIYVASGNGKLYAFDASASFANCSGTPTTCRPLWTAVMSGGVFFGATAVASGTVYVGSGTLSPSSTGTLYAFDAAGTTNCSGTPKTCKPLWTATTASPPSAPAVASGHVYVSEFGGPLYVFDAAGKTGCSGTPKTCAPLWTAPTGAFSQESSPAVANGVVYIGSGESTSIGQLRAFDASGTTHCSGTPKTCTPIFTSNSNFFPMDSSPAVANSFVYIGEALGPGIAAFHFG